jgi:hypothetical protein
MSNRVFDDEDIECIAAQIFSNTQRVFPMRLLNPTYFFPYVGNSRGWEVLLLEILLHAIPSSNGTRENGENHDFATPFKEKGEDFNLTCSSSTPSDFMPYRLQ